MNASTPAADLTRFLTLSDTAVLLGISTQRARALVRSGELPAIQIGTDGPWRVERVVLESYIEAMYEATRRASLWQQSDFATIAEPTFGERRWS
jgi:excisionase family DNA binding protein